MQKFRTFIILALVLLAVCVLISNRWTFLYTLGGADNGPGFERITGIKQLPPGFITPGKVLVRWYNLFHPPSATADDFDHIKNLKAEYPAVGMWDIEYLPDGTIFYISRSSNLHKMFSQDGNKLLENQYLPAGSDAEEPFASNLDNAHYSIIDRGDMKISGRDAAWLKVTLRRKYNLHDVMRGYKTYATAFVAECPLKDKDELVSIYAISPSTKFNMEAMQKLVALMKL